MVVPLVEHRAKGTLLVQGHQSDRVRIADLEIPL